MNSNKIAILVNNTVTYDGRVIKTAESLAGHGFEVVVFAVLGEEHRTFEFVNGVVYQRYPKINKLGLKAFKSSIDKAFMVNSALVDIAPEPRPLKKNPSQKVRDYPPRNTVKGFCLRGFRYVRVKFWTRACWYLREKFVHELFPGLALTKVDKISEMVAKRYFLGVHDFNPDLIFSNDLDCAFAAYLYGVSLKIPFVYDVHEFELDRPNRRDPKEIKRAAEVEKGLLKRAAGVITVSDDIAAWHHEHSGVDIPTVIYNSPAHAFTYGAGKQKLRASLGLEQADTLAVYTGLVALRRGLEEAIKAMALLPKLHLALVGPNKNPNAHDELLRVAEESEVSGRLHFIDAVPFNEVPYFISDADFGLIPAEARTMTQKFGLPNKLFEMIFAGIPVVVVDIPQRKKILKSFGVGFYMPDNKLESIEKVFGEVVSYCSEPNNKEIARSKGLEAFHRIGWKAQEGKIIELCNQVLK